MNEKSLNYYNIYNELYKGNELSILELSKLSGLSVPTVTKITDELIEDDLIVNIGLGDSTGGRKPNLFRINENSRYSIGIDISPNKISIILVNILLRIIDRRVLDIEEIKTFDEIMSLLKLTTEKLIKSNSIDNERILGIGISVHGVINNDRMVLSVAPNMGLRNINFDDYLSELPYDIYIENEANNGALAEQFFYNNDNINTMVYISIHEGLGTGVILNGDLMTGINKRAGEFGHMKISDDNQRQCNCGRTGCWETYCSDKALKIDYFDVTGVRVESIEEIFYQYNIGDENSIKVIDRYLSYLCMGLVNIILAIDPDLIIVGGTVSKYLEQFDKIIKDKIFTECNLYNENQINILYSKLQEDSSLLGAALLPLKKILL